jgi:hypothetical protein
LFEGRLLLAAEQALPHVGHRGSGPGDLITLPPNEVVNLPPFADIDRSMGRIFAEDEWV